jgi:hypothetical protein
MTLRASDTRRGLAGVLVTMAVGLLLVAAGCSDDPSDPTYPDEPQPEVGTWFLAVWGTGPDDVYVVGQPGLIYHYDGSSWARQESGVEVALTDVWGPGDGTVYVTGHEGVILRKSGGGGWSAMESGTEVNLFGIGSYGGQILAAGREGTLRRLDGSAWRNASEEIYQRNTEDAVIDTLIRSEEIESLTSVGHYGVAGSDGVILMNDPDTVVEWQLRRVTGGEDWITSMTRSERISGNFVATDGGRLFQLREIDGGRLAWRERFSPALGAIVYGIHADNADTVWAVTNDGRINRIDPDNSFHALYEDGLVLFDIWGSSGTDLYAVGIGGRVLRFHEVNPGEFGWAEAQLPDVPAGNKHATVVFDKFGRPVR